jgi:hypothetical protein
MYLEHRSASIVQAAEALHRARWDWTKLSKKEYKRRREELVDLCPPDWRSWLSSMLQGRNDPSLRERLVDLVRRAVDAGFPYVIPDVFVDDLLKGRNAASHGAAAGTSYEYQYWIGGALAWVIRTLVLVDLGITGDELTTCLANNLQFARCARALGWSKA